MINEIKKILNIKLIIFICCVNLFFICELFH